ncbi:MAG: leucyl aminopeptidase [Candidatus Cloacimonetes bacterium]|nr:leucyl aminopeptidase [Candidatus Cloacimonadota bacterium]
MKIHLEKQFAKADTVIIPGFHDDKPDLKKWINLKPGTTTDFVSDFSWKKNKRVYLSAENLTLILIGLEEKEKWNDTQLRKKVAGIYKELTAADSVNASLILEPMLYRMKNADVTRISAETILNSSYKFDKYREKDEDEISLIKEIALILPNPAVADKVAHKEGIILGEAMILARSLINEPANTLTPSALAKAAEKAGNEFGFETEVFDEKVIKKLKMEAFWAVAKGSEALPRLIVMRYKGDPNAKEILGLVGKGLTYDSGGYALKPGSGMVDMNMDMGGSGAVIGAMSAIAAMKLPVNVTAVVAACENMVSGGAFRNGDIIGSMSGKTIHVGNTDAEGRLTLIDAITYAIEKEHVAKVVDIATLTGAVLVCLGSLRTGIISNDDEFYSTLEKASHVSGDKIWRLPHDDEYRELLKSEVADISNIGHGRSAGTITAGLFIRDFVQDKPWIHCDIAGSANETKGAKLATGAGVRLLYFLAKLQ